ncbi:Octaprenyl diphosphate synthase [Pediococcus damnosus]|uniref:Farnesyl diphosphate synthase n=1 Tax=Pediococcus damnosus TaxID=51663 RepID=A0AAC9B0W9_9LACO|nr:farnesyl diphosphate synthase [Pediococcus damnosus]AMV61412.1 Octaprenyl diphosphate synthase [Pediococcus damnosus]AMV62230.1 Octaprenyl diphosphate synthase [Pediococcus damnosus]AMV65774.1 Octaprenyl diphosphate synthase [Pediococcus damnosus]AMV67913.1 Octaprenyl diphosphate synthase [Pediococcus damnosus]AMV70111.1 Octaprenyl diphosphate synthase [Pediococcus damnosus]
MSDTITKTFIQENTVLLNDYLKRHLPEDIANEQLSSAMQYSVLAGGKRLRPLLLLAMVKTFGGSINESTLKVAASLELLHTYSLIHDDLPAMDDDDLRRGIPTNHKKYGEAVAILAGDGLLTLSFEWLATAGLNTNTTVKLTRDLAQAAGAAGMVAGQVSDILGENKQLTFKQLKQLHRQKTGALIKYTALATNDIVNPEVDNQKLLIQFAESFGLAFQIYDDLEDVVGTQQALGKAVRKDANEHKNTYPGLRGVPQTILDLKKCVQYCHQALSKLEKNHVSTELLQGFLNYFQLDEEEK